MSILHRRRKWRDYSDAKYARGDGVCRHAMQSVEAAPSVDVETVLQVVKPAPAPAKRKRAVKKKAAKRCR